MDQKHKEPRSTSELFHLLSHTREIDEFIRQNNYELFTESFSQYLSNLCNTRELIPEQVIKRSLIERTYGHQLFNGTRKPSRDKVIQLAFGMGLTLDDAQKLLLVARKSTLYPRIKRDAVIIFCLEKHLDLLETQALLESLQLTMLGED